MYRTMLFRVALLAGASLPVAGWGLLGAQETLRLGVTQVLDRLDDTLNVLERSGVPGARMSLLGDVVGEIHAIGEIPGGEPFFSMLEDLLEWAVDLIVTGVPPEAAEVSAFCDAARLRTAEVRAQVESLGTPSFRRGDSNGDGSVNISDAIHVLRYLFQDGARVPGCLKAADAADDGSVNLTDSIRVLRWYFRGGAPPPPPFPGCGPDPTADALTCESPGGCEP